MNFLKKLSPHGAILIANMYYVFWGIDRVNKSMNFIDNKYTKFLFLVLLFFTAVNLATLYRSFSRWARRKSEGVQAARLGLMAVTALFAIVYFILWLVDCFAPGKMLMLNEFVKLWMLIYCALNTVDGILLVAWDRAELRRAQNRPAPRRAPVRQEDRRSGGSNAPRRYEPRSNGYSRRYEDGYGSAGRYNDRYSSTRRSDGYSSSRYEDGYSSSRRSSRYDDGYTSPRRSSASSRYDDGYGSSRRYDDGYTSSRRSGSSSRYDDNYGSSRRYDDGYASRQSDRYTSPRRSTEHSEWD